MAEAETTYACPGGCGFKTQRFGELADHRQRELGDAQGMQRHEREALQRIARRARTLRWALERSGAGKVALPVARVLSVLELSAGNALRSMEDPTNGEPGRIEAWIETGMKELKRVGVDAKQLQGVFAGVPRLEIAPGARLEGPALAAWTREFGESKSLKLPSAIIERALASLEAGNVLQAMEIAGMPTAKAMPVAPFDGRGMLTLPASELKPIVTRRTCGCGATLEVVGGRETLVTKGLNHRHGWRTVKSARRSGGEVRRPG